MNSGYHLRIIKFIHQNSNSFFFVDDYDYVFIIPLSQALNSIKLTQPNLFNSLQCSIIQKKKKGAFKNFRIFLKNLFIK